MKLQKVQGNKILSNLMLSLASMVLWVVLGVPLSLYAQTNIDENCTASILNRSVQVNSDGTFAIPNVPVEPGSFRVRITCEQDGITIGGQSIFLTLTPDGATSVQSIGLGEIDQIPVSLEIIAERTTLTTKGESLQLFVIGTLPDGQTRGVTSESAVLGDVATFVAFC